MHAAVATAEAAAVQLAKLSGLLGLSPVAERHLGTITAPDDDGDCFHRIIVGATGPTPPGRWGGVF